MLSMGAANVVVAPAENLRVEPENATVSSRSFLGVGERVLSAPPGNCYDVATPQIKREGGQGAGAHPPLLPGLAAYLPMGQGWQDLKMAELADRAHRPKVECHRAKGWFCRGGLDTIL
jgi:hypothetical protein